MDLKPPDELIRQTLEEVIQIYLIPKFLSLGMNASGSWINSLSVEVIDGVGYIKGKDYTEYLNNGRGPNKDQSKEGLRAWAYWYGKNVIKPWAATKGIIGSDGTYTAIAYSIAKNGTKTHSDRWGFIDILESPDVTNYIYNRLGGYMAGQIRAEIVRQLKATLT